MSERLPVDVSIGLVDKLSASMDKLKTKFPELSSAVKQVQTNFDFLQKSSEDYRKSIEKISTKVGGTLKGIGKAMTVGVTAPVVAGAAYSVHKFSEIEDALVDLQGSTDLSGNELQTFGERLRKLSINSTFGQQKLLELAASAGEAGVRGAPNLEKFALTLAQLGKTAKIEGPDVAASLREILTLTKEGEGSVGNFGSAITALENKYGANAKKIFENTQMMAREVGRFGLSSSQLAAVGAAIVPLGFESKNAAQAVGESFRAIDNAIREGGVKMQGLQKITGMTADELRKTFKEDPQAVFKAFLTGINKIEERGGQTAKALEFFGVSGDKSNVILTALGKNLGQLGEMEAYAGEEFRKNTALNDEYSDTTKSLSASTAKFKSTLDALAVTLGNRLAPFVQGATTGMTGLLVFFEKHPTVATFAAAIAAVAAAVGPLLIGAGQLIMAIPKLIDGFKALQAVFVLLNGTWVAATAAFIVANIWWIAIAAAIIALVAVIWIFRDAIVKGVVAAWDWVIERVQKAMALIKQAGALFAQYNPVALGAKAGTAIANMITGPSAPALPTPETAAGNSDFVTQTNNARVDINVRAPQSTSIVGESQGGFMSINRGLAGAF